MRNRSTAWESSWKRACNRSNSWLMFMALMTRLGVSLGVSRSLVGRLEWYTIVGTPQYGPCHPGRQTHLTSRFPLPLVLVLALAAMEDSCGTSRGFRCPAGTTWAPSPAPLTTDPLDFEEYSFGLATSVPCLKQRAPALVRAKKGVLSSWRW